MAVGDKARAAGLTTYDETQVRRLGYENDNRNADYIAEDRDRLTVLEGQQVRPAEFTTTANTVAPNTVTGAGTIARVTSGTTDTSIAAPINSTATAHGITVQPGVYAVTWKVNMSASAQGRTFLELVDASTSETLLRQSIVAQEDQGGIAVPSVNILAAKNLTLRIYHTNSAALNVTGSLRITRWR